jgi:hypothetical protein
MENACWENHTNQRDKNRTGRKQHSPSERKKIREKGLPGVKLLGVCIPTDGGDTTRGRDITKKKDGEIYDGYGNVLVCSRWMQ